MAKQNATGEYTEYVLEQLGAMPGLRARRMFGGTGIYSDQVFFAIIADGRLYFKVDDGSREQYTSRGMEAFRPYADRPGVSMSYFEVPPDIVEDATELLRWAGLAAGVALAARKGLAHKRAARRLG
jgi:DNA transformation protein and related proteins